jgi:inner membrane protein
MDNPTHSLFGLMLSRAGLNRLCPRADLLLILAANAPDLDVVTWIWGTTGHIAYHRWYTHAWLMLPLVALLPVLLTRFFVKERFPWAAAYALSLVGCASHVVLDWMNVFGIRTLLPFSSQWFHLDLLFIIDPWIWAFFTLALAAPFLSSLVSSEMGARRSSGQGWAIFALLAVTLYLGGRYLLHERALDQLNARLYERATPKRVAAFPTFANPLRWRTVVETDAVYWVQSINVLDQFDPTSGRAFYKPEWSPDFDAVGKTWPFQVFLDFNHYPLWRRTPLSEPEGARRVELFDLRFGDPVQPGFVASAEVLANGRVEQPRISFGQLLLKE